MFSATVKDNFGRVVAKAPCCMTLAQAQDFADTSAIDYRKENAIHYYNRTQYPYCSIVIETGCAKWWKWFPVSSDLKHTEC